MMWINKIKKDIVEVMSPNGLLYSGWWVIYTSMIYTLGFPTITCLLMSGLILIYFPQPRTVDTTKCVTYCIYITDLYKMVFKV